MLDRVGTAKLRAYANETEMYFTGGTFLPPATVQGHSNKGKQVTTNSKCEEIDLLGKQSRSVQKHGLTTPDQRTFL